MCCASRLDIRHALIKYYRKSRRKTFIAWKRIRVDKKPVFASPVFAIDDYQYKPGWNYALRRDGKIWVGKYNVRYPRGLHVYLMYPPYYQRSAASEIIVPVTVKIDDIVRVDEKQLVTPRFCIAQADWDYAFQYQKKTMVAINRLIDMRDYNAKDKLMTAIPSRWEKLEKQSHIIWAEIVSGIHNVLL